MSRTNPRKINEELIKQNYFNTYMKEPTIENLGLQSQPKSQPFFSPKNIESSMLQTIQKQLRLNIINKENESERISIISKANCTISQLKRKIQSQFYELNNKSILIKVIQNSRGFVFSNNSVIGDHAQNGDTIYIVTHDSKEGDNMNLPSDLSDIFLTLRYVTKSVIKKLTEVSKTLSLREVLSEMIPFGFWYANSDLVEDFLKLVNQMITANQLQILEKSTGEVLNNLILKFISFWLMEIPNVQEVYPEVFQQILVFIQKLSLSSYFGNILKTTKIAKKVTEMSRNIQDKETAQQCMKIMKTINRKVRNFSSPPNLKFEYIPSVLEESNAEGYTLEEAFEMFSDKQDNLNQIKALEIFADVKNKLCLEATVRFDNYWRLINEVLNFKLLKDKKNLKNFAIVIEELNRNTSETRAGELLQKNLLKKLHDFLLESPIECHRVVGKYCENLLNLAAKNGQLSVKKVSDLFNSPYQDFLIILCTGLEKNNEIHTQKGKGFSLMYINSIKDLIRMSLKSENPNISRPLLKILSNLSLDEQCRYQILNLKGIEIFVKLLQTNKSNIEIQRICAKGLLNLAISSRDVKVKALAQMTQVIEMYYKRELDSIAAGYVETILKTAKV